MVCLVSGVSEVFGGAGILLNCQVGGGSKGEGQGTAPHQGSGCWGQGQESVKVRVHFLYV